MDKEFKTLKQNFGFVVDKILTAGKISKPYYPLRDKKPDLIEDVKFLWDTGATNTVITKEIAKKLGLFPSGQAITHGVGGEHLGNTYIISVELSNGAIFPFIKVTEGILNGFDVLIGMDIISYGDFSITNYNRQTIFSFTLPSIKENVI